jgi:phosphotransacetylase
MEVDNANSEVAGQASVLIFSGFKYRKQHVQAVQRETGALAIGL